MTPDEETRFLALSRTAMRCNLLRTFTLDGVRRFSRDLVTDLLYQQFCLVTPETAPSKSQLFRFAAWLPADELRHFTSALNTLAAQTDAAGQSPLGLAEPVELATGWGDSTAVETPIHYPVDWLLIKDAIRSLILAIQCIRAHGLRCRMPAPDRFLNLINKLCIRMSQAKRQEQAAAQPPAGPPPPQAQAADQSSAAPAHPQQQAPARKRKRASRAQQRQAATTQQRRVVRAMLRVLALVEAHARRHRLRLYDAWEQTGLTICEANRIAQRITHVLELLPQVRTQVTDRLLLGKQVEASKKLLSLYHPTTCTLVRGKTGRLVEFGHMLWLVEQRDGLLLDWELAETPTLDPVFAEASITRMAATYPGQIHTFVTDRGCDSPAVRTALETVQIRRAIRPRSPREDHQRQAEPFFRALQRRRCQTEPRISIIKHQFLGLTLRAHSNPARARAVAWAVLTHNLWVLARLPCAAAVPRAA